MGAKRLSANPFAALVTTVRREVDARLGGLLDAKVDAARALGPEVEEMVSAFRDLCLRGGKRLRAALVVAGYRIAAPDADLEPALDAAVAVELLHAYFLVHDDWMDGDPTRRGGPSVHALLSSRLGSSTLGASSAILAGDLGVALAQEALARVDVPPARLPRVFAAFAEMQADAIAGQQRDVVARGGDVELTYRLKTGSYTAAGPLRLGALLGGARERLVGGLERVAVPAGVAFQLRDDLLSLFAESTETGKPFANDLRAGKRTALIVALEQLGSPADRAAVRRVLGKPRATEASLR
ncbi:MAG: polyprenyl synthetase family protein, partial [Deltaproteobacteria bacterium]|nr:polyprenyl synthetase family protein [Deltaproteobacteria bacterium]